MKVSFGPKAPAGLFLLVAFAAPITAALADDTPNLERVAAEYATGARPLLAKHCLKCHSTEAMEGELDLERFATLADVRKATGVWLRVAEMLDNGEMPPKDARRMPDEERQSLRGWLARYLKAEALAGAGDPGPVVLRRLSNAQYTYTLRDLTGVPLDPAREFPADGAAGEGFTNAGNALVMSPALLAKYLDAAKGVASHAVPLPDGLRFSPRTTRRDWTNEIVDQIRSFYGEFADSGGDSKVNLQGIVFGTNAGGRLPIEHYLAATLAERVALAKDTKSIEAVARERKLSPKYLGLLWSTLNATDPSPALDDLRARWKAAGPADAGALAERVALWQSKLWKFNSVGHIGKAGGPKSWMEPVSPLATRQEFRVPLAARPGGEDVTIYLAADAVDAGAGQVSVVWDRPRLVAPGMPDLMLRDAPGAARALAARRVKVFSAASRSLAAASEAIESREGFDPSELARKHDVAPDVLDAWLGFLGLGRGRVSIESPLQGRIAKASGFDFVNGWGSGETPNVLANASDTHVRIPGNLRPHSLAMHPSPTLRVATGWQSPVSGTLRIVGKVQHAHPECGNGVTWSLEVRRGSTRQRLASGATAGARVVPVGPFEGVRVRTGDLVALAIGPRDGNHSCDLTAVDLKIEAGGKTWDLATDVSPDILAGNPHADRLGNPAVWHFFTETDRDQSPDSGVPPGSLLARWREATEAERRQSLALEFQALLTAGPPAAADHPDARLYRQLASPRGPLLRAPRAEASQPAAPAAPVTSPAAYGRQPSGEPIHPSSLAAQAPSVIAVTIPGALVEGCEFVTTGRLGSGTGQGGAQLAVSTTRLENRPSLDPSRPLIVAEAGPARERFESAFRAFRQLLPAALCYAKVVPVDEVITLTLFHREDEPLVRLMLDDAQAARLDRLWSELRFVSQDALTLVDAFQQLLEYASQDGDPRVFEPLRKPIADRASAFRKALVAAEPRQLDAVLKFAEKAYRRPLRAVEAEELRSLYRKLRVEEIPHDEACRLVLARVLVAPAFLYRVETPASGTSPSPVSDHELANRLSYFLWSSAPDDTLRDLAASGRLRDPDVLAAQARRMLTDDRVRRLATEFACQWLHVYDFDALDEKSERHFPTFRDLRGAMYEETILFFADLFRRDLPALAFLDADHTFLNGPLAAHYGIPGVSGDAWRRVDGIKAFGRGGILGLSSTLARQSGASRTSPILRGNWVSEVLLGEKLPKPPPGVPVLPDDESSSGGLTVRQLVEKHTSDAKCATCHARIDPIGFSLEAYDAIGRKRLKDLADHPVEVDVKMQDGTAYAGLDGLRDYLLTKRRDSVSRQFSRKLLGYTLGRGVQLSDEPLLDEMTRLIAKGGRIGDVVEALVRSRQFREIRGRDTVVAEGP